MAAACRGPLPPGWPHSRLHLEPGDSCLPFPAGLRLGQGRAGRRDGRTPTAAATVRLSHGRLPPGASVPTEHLCKYLPAREEGRRHRAGLQARPGAPRPAFWPAHGGSASPSGEWAGYVSMPACPPPPPGQPEEFIGDWAHDLVTEMTVCYRAARVAALCCWGPAGVRSELGVGTRGDPALGVWGRPHLQHDESWGGGTRGAAGPRGPGQGP